MKVFQFQVDEAFAKQNNELLKDTKRLQVAAVVLGILLILGAAGLFAWWSQAESAVGLIGGIIAATFGLLFLFLAVIVPRKVGGAQQLYDTYPLAPAVVAEVNDRNVVLMALVNTNVNEHLEPRWAVALRQVTKIHGVEPKLGTRIPVVAVQGRRRVGDQEHWEEITPMPIAWGTPDQDVVNTARREIPEAQWTRLDKARKRLDEAKSTRHNLLVL